MLVVSFAFGCERAGDVHETKEASSQPCITCHSSAFALAASPKHVDVLPIACDGCHNTRLWTPATITDHPWFALNGKHTKASCAGCHTGTPAHYADTPTNCVDCHLADYQKSAYPVHDTFAHGCSDCHDETGWKPAFGGFHPEDKFPIQSGSHATSAIACVDCHDRALGSPVAGANTDCTHCHLGAHNRPAIDPIHNFLGSAYPGANASSPSFCRGCHPTG